MPTLINFLSEYIATWPGFSLLVVVLLLCISVFKWRTNKLMLGAENALLDSRFWYIPTDVQSFFAYINRNIGREGLNLYALTQITLDIIFAIAYGTLFAALIVRLYGAEIDWRLVIIPILAATADLSENVTTAYLAWSYSNASSPLAWLACGFTLMKWIMFFLSLFLIAIGGLRKLI